MLNLFNDRCEYDAIKEHLENTFEQQYWAKDIVARAISEKFKQNFSNLIVVGPKACGKRRMMELISKFLHVPFLVIDCAHEIKACASNPENYILPKLLRASAYDIEKAASGIILLRSVNHCRLEMQESVARLMQAGYSTKIVQGANEKLPLELIDKEFHFCRVMIVATIDCDIEGKIARRYVNDIINRKINRSTAVRMQDLMKLNVCQKLASLFNYIAPFHCKFDQLLRVPFCRV